MKIDEESFFWKTQRGEVPDPNTVETLGVEFVKIDTDLWTTEMNFVGKPEFTNPSGNIQGGFLAAMLDDVMAANLAALLKKGEYAPTVSMNIQYLRPGKVGKFKGFGEVVKKGKKICYLSGRLEQDDHIVATATASAIITSM